MESDDAVDLAEEEEQIAREGGFVPRACRG